MADVSVEFGAKDTGLEQTLKTVQAQLTSLEDEVKSGTLSFDELQQAMRKIAQAEKVEEQLRGMADSMSGAGDAASGAAPQIDDSANSMDEVGNAATDAGKKSEGGFLQMAAAVATGQAAVELAMGAIKGAIDGVVGMFDKFGQALDRGAELDILSTRTGVASGELARLQRALENTGASGDMIGPIFDRMNRALAGSDEEGSKASEALSKLGLSADAIKSLSPEQQFETIGKALSQVADSSDRAALAQDLFGRGAGTRLLRLFQDYEGTMAQVDRQLGVFPSIMNEMSKSFEAASTEINAAKQKMVEFATGILSRVMPAVEAIATGLASIDAAALGQKLADAFTGGSKAMEGFQAAIDAIKLGEFGKAFELVFESIKLQSMQTGNEIYKRLTAAFQSVGQFIGAIFDPSGALLTTVANAFSLLGKRIASDIQRDLATTFEALPMGLGDGVALALNNMANESNTAANKIADSFQGAGGRIASQFSEAGAAFPESFSQNYENAKPLFADIQAQTQKVSDLQAEIAAKVKELNKELENTSTTETAIAETVTQSNDEKGKHIQLQIDLNNAIASGNVEEQKRLEALIAGEKRLQDIEKTTAQIVKETQMSEKAAREFATKLVDSKIAADNLTASMGSARGNAAGTKDELISVKGVIADIEKAKLEDAPQRLLERTREARGELKSMKDFIGEDLSKMSLTDIIKKLGIDGSKLQNDRERLVEIEKAVAAIGSADPADITPEVDLPGVNDRLEKVKEFLRTTGTEKPDVTPQIDQQKVQSEVDKVKSTLAGQNLQIKVEVDQPSLNAAVAQMQTQITNQFTGGDGGEGGAGGSGGQGGPGGDAQADTTTISDLLNGWTNIITAIRDRLPMQALA
jgi:ribosome-associated translation inhibitor RaiA